MTDKNPFEIRNELKDRYCYIRYNENVGVNQNDVGVNVDDICK